MKYDSIDPLLSKCAAYTTDASFGRCLLKVAPVPATLLKPAPTLSMKYASMGPPLVNTSITGAEIIGGSGLRTTVISKRTGWEQKEVKGCQPSEKKNALGPCRVELDVPSEEDQQRLNLPNTPVLRFCSEKGKEGTLVPVATPDEALEKTKAFCKCSTGEPAPIRKKCARSINHG